MDNRFQTETAAMRTLAFSSPRGDTSFKIGLALVTLFAAVEIFFGGYYYVGRVRGHHTASAARTSTQPSDFLPTATPAPSVAAPASTVAPAPVAVASPPAPVVAADERLLREGMELSNRGDTATALNRFEQATEKNPNNIQAYVEMARIYESTNNLERSNQMWRKVYEFGPSAGSLYTLADARLRRGVTATPVPAVVEATPAQAPPTPPPSEGIPEGSTFGISEVTAAETTDPDADMNLLLKIGVKKRATAVIDHTRVKIQVFFYDTVDDRDIKLTDAEVNYEWLTPDHDWASSRPEVLAVTYVRPKNKARSQETALADAAASLNPNKKGAGGPSRRDPGG